MAWRWSRHAIEQTQHARHTQVAVRGGRVHDVFEIEAFAVAAGERGRGYGQALLAALLLALAAAAPRPVVVVTLPRPQTEGFWKTTLLEWSRGSEGERGVWRALVAEDGAVEFAYPQDAATTLFWSETADRALRAVSPCACGTAACPILGAQCGRPWKREEQLAALRQHAAAVHSYWYCLLALCFPSRILRPR